MTRRTNRGLASPAPVVSGNAVWALRAMAEGGTLSGEPIGLNPKGATPWRYQVQTKDQRDRWEIPSKTVTALTHAGIIAGRAGHRDGKPVMHFTITAQGEQALARIEETGAVPDSRHPTRGAR